MTFFEHKIPKFMVDRRNLIQHAIFTAVFALVFINIYAPFGADKWYEVTRPEFFLYSSFVILTGFLVIAISRITMYWYGKSRDINYGGYALWIASEIVSMAAIYVLLSKLVLNVQNDIFTVFRETVSTTTLVLLFPYTLSWMYFSWKEKKQRLDDLTEQGITTFDNKKLIPFKDEKGDLRFSLKANELLYLEASDNYVIIHYMDNGKRSKFMIRNSLKNIELQLRGKNIIRCHRSFMVNFEKIKIVKKEKDGLVLELDLPERQLIPITKTYVNKVMELFTSNV